MAATRRRLAPGPEPDAARPGAGARNGSIGLAQLRPALGDRVVVQFLAHGDRQAAVVVSPTTATMVDLGPSGAIARATSAVLDSLRQLAPAAALPVAEVLAGNVRRQLDQFHRLVLAPLLPAVGDAAEVVVLPVGDLFSLPWAKLLGRTAVVAPSAKTWLAAGDHVGRTGHVAVVAGPGLPGAVEEARAVAALHGPDAMLLAGDEATTAAVTRAFERAGLAHVAAHAHLRALNPWMGHVLLADGPATVLDLEDIRQPPAILVLSGCSTSLVSSNRSGELLGLATALLAAGSASVVMSTLPLPDAASVEGAMRLHRALAAGAPIGAAVTAAGGRGDDGSPLGLLAACALSVAGRGEATAALSSRA